MQTILHQNESGLISAFDPPRGITALVGGGGKTTLMLRLARELAKSGARVIVTTTTHIFPPEKIPTYNPIDAEQAREMIARNNLVCFGKPAGQGKLSAPDLSMDDLALLTDYVLVEADGAKHLPLKAPNEHEPVIPPKTKLVIAVAGLDGVGQTIRNAAFRPELFAELCGKSEREIVSAQDVACVLTHPQGMRKNVTGEMRFAVLLNKADDDTMRGIAHEIASEIDKQFAERVVIAALGKE